jgi:hypothetical protein
MAALWLTSLNLSDVMQSVGFPGQENHSCDISTQKTHSCGFLIVLHRLGIDWSVTLGMNEIVIIFIRI